MKKFLLKIIYVLYAFLAKTYIRRHKPIVIGITWSVWKTSCRMVIFQVFKQLLEGKNIYTSPKNFNSELGLVFSIFKLEEYNPWIKSLIKIFFKFLRKAFFWKKEYDILVLEYWVDHPWDMDFLLKIVKPDYSIFTKLDYIHVENFSSKKEIWEEKIKLIENTKIKAYLNKQDEFLKDSKKSLNVDSSFFNKKWELKYKYICEWKWIKSVIKSDNNVVKTNIMWEDNFVYLALALKILKKFDVDYVENGTFIKLINQPWRFELFNWITKSVLIDSSYNAWPASMLKMIENTNELKKNIFKKYKILFVVWDMRELWKRSKTEHRKLYAYLKSYWEIISVWEETKKYFGTHLWNFKYSKDAWTFLKTYLKKSNNKYLILFKWSQTNIYTEEAIKQVLENNKNEDKLVRQEYHWLEKKQTY